MPIPLVHSKIPSPVREMFGNSQSHVAEKVGQEPFGTRNLG